MKLYCRLGKSATRRPTSRSVLALVVLGSMAACDRGPTLTEPIASQITIFGGDRQRAAAGSTLPSPLSVRVTDSGDRGVPNVKVYWQITAGAGELHSPFGHPLIQSFTVTNADGVAHVFVLFTLPGTSTVSASVTELQGPPLTFTTIVTKPPDVTIRFGPMWETCTPFNDPSVFQSSDVTVPVGAVVEWVYGPWLEPSCMARITSSAVPPGGEPIDSEIIMAGQTFQFVPRVAGTWEYVDAINGGRGTLTARAP